MNPTILFVHGAWHNPQHYRPIMEELETDGYPCVCPHLPSDDAEPPEVLMYEDAAVIKAAAQDLICEGREVVVVGHSYGGVVTTEAIAPEFGREHRSSQGLSGGVKRLFYQCAFLLHTGESLGSAFGGELPPFVQIERDGSCYMLDPKRRFYSALPEERQDYWLSLTHHHCASASLTPLKQEAYKHIPTTYLFTTKDEALPYEVQQMMVAHSGADITTEKCDGDHSPYLSQQSKVVAAIKRAVGMGSRSNTSTVASEATSD